MGRTRVAYFSMEIAISPEMPTYSRGLGILAGDTARAAAELDLPIVFVTLISRRAISGRNWTRRVARLM
jgi:starch phosphorylase